MLRTYKLRGRANYNGCCGKYFEIVVQADDQNFESYQQKKVDAFRAVHPDCTGIIVNSCTKL